MLKSNEKTTFVLIQISQEFISFDYYYNASLYSCYNEKNKNKIY